MSAWVNPKYSSSEEEEIVSETKLLVPVKILSFAIFRQPVIEAKRRVLLSFSAVLMRDFISSSICG